MMFRVGVHLGEVIVDDEDQNIFGDGVNLAARIQALAEPGGIAVSRVVRDLVELRVAYGFVDAGEPQLRTVSRPTQVCRVRPSRRAATVGANDTTRMVPQVTLRFEGTDSTSQKHSFDVALDKLVASSEGMVIGGAADQCDLVVAHATVSRRHARLSLAGDGLPVEDLAPSNAPPITANRLHP